MIDGFLLVNKPKGITSRTVCNKLSHSFNEKKVGHIGTLDPFATGLLIVEFGKANKAGAFIEKLDKTYIATLRLGETTDTLDETGKNIGKQAVPPLDEKTINDTFSSFIGRTMQTPPMTSAIHVNGVKLYKLAHKGEEIERPQREIEVAYIKLISFSKNEIVFEAQVSSGTYIRVLAADIAKKLGTLGYLVGLKRINIGAFSIDDAYSIDEAQTSNLIDIYSMLKNCVDIEKVDELTAKNIADGKQKNYQFSGTKKYLMITDQSNNPIAMYIKTQDNIYEHKRGLF